MRPFIVPPAALLAVVLVSAAVPSFADEGMWTFNDFPVDRVQKAYGFAPDQAWLDHVRLSSLRLARGCSASFVTPNGLVQTNHHCAQACIAQLSTATEDLVERRLLRQRGRQEERKCPNVEVNQLVAISDVTVRISEAIAGRDGKALTDAKKAIEATIARECSGGDTQHPLRRRRALSRRHLQSLPLPPLSGRAARLRARTGDRVLRRRPGQFRVSALRPRRDLSAGLCGRPPARYVGELPALRQDGRRVRAISPSRRATRGAPTGSTRSPSSSSSATSRCRATCSTIRSCAAC